MDKQQVLLANGSIFEYDREIHIYWDTEQNTYSIESNLNTELVAQFLEYLLGELGDDDETASGTNESEVLEEDVKTHGPTGKPTRKTVN